MKSIQEFILEAKAQQNPYTEKELKEIQKSYKGKDTYFMGGIEDENYHLYVKPNRFKGKFYNKVDGSRGIFLSTFIEDINKTVPNLILFVKTWEAIDTQSRINNLNKTYYCILLPENGMLFNNMKEAKTWIKDHQHNKYVSGGKKVKCKPMTIADAMETLKPLIADYKFSSDCGVYMHD